MEFTQVVRTPRSVRQFAKKDIAPEVLERVLEAARMAPSGNNQQPWRYVVVRDKKRRAEIAKHCYEQMFVADAPVVIVCLSECYDNPYEPAKDKAYLNDAIIGIDHLVLAARNEGLGTCWIGALHPDPIRKLLKVPGNVDIVMVIAMGYPKSDAAFHETTNRLPLEKILFAEEFDKPWSA